MRLKKEFRQALGLEGDTMEVAVVTMTPEWAIKLLERNTRNRPVKRRNLERITRAMSEGRFELNGEAIQIDVNGDLINGQHRLWACVESGAAFQTVLVQGLAPNAQDTIDIGSARQSGDQLHLYGYSNAGALAGAVRQIFGYLEGSNQNAHVDTTQILPFLEQHTDLPDAVKLGSKARNIVAPSILSAVIWLGSRSPESAMHVAAFVEPLENGEGLAAGDPRLALRNSMLNMRMRNNSRAPRPDYTMAATTHAWNAYASGRKLSVAKAHMGPKGRYEQPHVIGAPPPGSGMAMLNKVVLRSGKSVFQPR